MPLPGGPAAKLGDRYEDWWTVRQLIRLLNHEIMSLRIEVPLLDAAEFVVTCETHIEYHQSKRSNSVGKWTLRELRSDVLSSSKIQKLLSEPQARFVFVSGSDAPELRELSERARLTQSIEEFTKVLSQDQIRSLQLLASEWKGWDSENVYNALRRVEVRTVDEASLKDQVEARVALLYEEPILALDALRSTVADCIHKTLDNSTLLKELAPRNLVIRQSVSAPVAARSCVFVTDTYLSSVRPKLIARQLFTRTVSHDLASKLLSSPSALECVLLGSAGSGKTACIIETIDLFRAADIPVLAFRLDHLGDANTSIELGQRLGLSESPAYAIKELSQPHGAVLVIDQLDVLSTTSGRSTGYLNALDSLLVEIRALRDSYRIHIIVACRSFDWRNDPRFRSMLREKHLVQDIREFTDDELLVALSSLNVRIERFTLKERQLLRLPQNLALIAEILEASGDLPTFHTQKDLFDLYWERKRNDVRERTCAKVDKWMSIISFLVESLDGAHELSIPAPLLDQFDPEYIKALVSEGVLSKVDRYFGFGHESFYDYCFARLFVQRGVSLFALLTDSEQHLYWRSRVRQVLTHLRDADPQRYSTEFQELLTQPEIRFHIKEVVLELIIGFPLSGHEKDFVRQCVVRYIQSLENGTQPDPLDLNAWRIAWNNSEYFLFFSENGLIDAWLQSKNEQLITFALEFIRRHQRAFPDVAVRFLRPMQNAGDDWKNKLCWAIRCADLSEGRPLFDLFLELVADGTFDGDGRSWTDAFWNCLHPLEKTKPGWIAEALAVWMVRRIEIVAAQPDDSIWKWHSVFSRAQGTDTQIMNAASGAPNEYLKRILPVVLNLVKLASHGEEMPVRDSVWSSLRLSDHPSIEISVLNGLKVAMTAVAQADHDIAFELIDYLLTMPWNVTNYLLLNILQITELDIAERAAEVLIREPWRMECELTESYSVARETLASIFPLCLAETQTKLLSTVLSYRGPKKLRYKEYGGYSTFRLLSAIPAEFWNPLAKKRFQELERKHARRAVNPRASKFGIVRSPISPVSASRMSDRQWLKALKKYSTDRNTTSDDIHKGGAWELSRVLETEVSRSPARFARLGLRFDSNTNPAYLNALLTGIEKADIPESLKFEVVERFFSLHGGECGSKLADVLSSFKSSVGEEQQKILAWLAAEHLDPVEERWEKETIGGRTYEEEIYTQGINCTRGRVALAVGNLCFNNPQNRERLLPLIEMMLKDPSVAVRSCVAYALLAIFDHDQARTLNLLRELLKCDDRLMATRHVQDLVNYGLRKHYDILRPTVNRMSNSSHPEVTSAGARFDSLAVLYGHPAQEYVQAAIVGSPPQRLGVAQVASHNLGNDECDHWCVEMLLRLAHDADSEVQGQVAGCFRRLEDLPLSKYSELISAFVRSVSFEADSFSLLHVLEESLHPLPSIVCEVCESFASRFGGESMDVSRGRHSNGDTVWKLILRVYAQHKEDSLSRRVLDVMDAMCRSGASESRGWLLDYER